MGETNPAGVHETQKEREGAMRTDGEGQADSRQAGEQATRGGESDAETHLAVE